MTGCAAVGRLQGKEAWAAPGRPGDGPGDRRQAGIGVSLPDIAFGLDPDGVAPTLIVADQHGADFEVRTLRTITATILPAAVA
jgi:hypothetical protein